MVEIAKNSFNTSATASGARDDGNGLFVPYPGDIKVDVKDCSDRKTEVVNLNRSPGSLLKRLPTATKSIGPTHPSIGETLDSRLRAGT